MSLFRRISNLFFGSRIDQEIDQEITAHIAWDAATLAVSAMLASYLPAHRAASVDPAHALRAE